MRFWICLKLIKIIRSFNFILTLLESRVCVAGESDGDPLWLNRRGRTIKWSEDAFIRACVCWIVQKSFLFQTICAKWATRIQFCHSYDAFEHFWVIWLILQKDEHKKATFGPSYSECVCDLVIARMKFLIILEIWPHLFKNFMVAKWVIIWPLFFLFTAILCDHHKNLDFSSNFFNFAAPRTLSSECATRYPIATPFQRTQQILAAGRPPWRQQIEILAFNESSRLSVDDNTIFNCRQKNTIHFRKMFGTHENSSKNSV